MNGERTKKNKKNLLTQYLLEEKESAIDYLIPKNYSSHLRLQCLSSFRDLVLELGPVIEEYPSWHPLVKRKGDNKIYPSTTPGLECGYNGLDHTIYFLNGFVTCPYQGGEDIIKSVYSNVNDSDDAYIDARFIKTPFYKTSAECVVVSCKWIKSINKDGSIPSRISTALMIESELPHWRRAQVGDSFNRMKAYFLGKPSIDLYTPFVDLKSARNMKIMYEMMLKSEIFGKEIKD